MPNKPLTLPNLIQLKEDYPGVHDDLQTLVAQHNLLLQAMGGIAQPIASGGLTVSGSNGVLDIAITDKHPQMGEDYFLEYALTPGFGDAHTVYLGAQRNYRESSLPGTTTYWRWYKSTKLGGTSNRIAFGSPTGVASGNFSTTNPGPVPGASQGSGQSQLPGYGWNSPSAGRGRLLAP